MGLTTTLNTAQTALQTNAALSSIVSRNIAGVNDANYSRKSVELVTNPSGAATAGSVTRATNDALFGSLLTANSNSASASALQTGLDTIEQTVSFTNTSTSSSDTSTKTTDTSPATMIGTLASALQTYSAAPSNTAAGQAVVDAAKALATNLNNATVTVQAVRTKADSDMATAVNSINSLLGQFQSVNQTVVQGKAAGTDVTDAQDQRNSILQQLSQQIGISTVANNDGGMSIYTDSGVTLFQGIARKVSFTPNPTYTAGTTGGAVTVDGVVVTGSSASMPIKSGAIAGLSQLRDVTTVNYQNQLDQIAQGLITSFGESDQSGGSAPTIAGLFTTTNSSADPSATSAATGLAGLISVNANVDTAKGGTLIRLRDGGIGDPTNSAYVANTSGAASYSTHLTDLLKSLDADQTFDPSSGGTAGGSVADYASSSLSWLESTRQSATTNADSTAAVVSATTSSLSSSTGVNLDDELSKMLDLEHAYSASAQLMSTVKSMYDSLLSAAQ